jgi:hypothetical protein
MTTKYKSNDIVHVRIDSDSSIRDMKENQS